MKKTNLQDELFLISKPYPILRTIYGSKLYGCNSDTSDVDIVDVVLPSLQDLVLTPSAIHKLVDARKWKDNDLKATGPKPKPKEAGEIDVKTYTLGDVITGVYTGNVIVAEVLNAGRDSSIPEHTDSAIWNMVVSEFSDEEIISTALINKALSYFKSTMLVYSTVDANNDVVVKCKDGTLLNTAHPVHLIQSYRILRFVFDMIMCGNPKFGSKFYTEEIYSYKYQVDWSSTDGVRAIRDICKGGFFMSHYLRGWVAKYGHSRVYDVNEFRHKHEQVIIKAYDMAGMI